MTYPYLEAHSITASGANRGSYSHVPCALRTISDTHNAVEVHHSLFSGDRMSFFQILESRKHALDRMRPIRFYNNDPDDSGVKLFDGVITDTNYAYMGADYMALRTNAAGWWHELAQMDLHEPLIYEEGDNWTVNEIYTDLVQKANDMGVMKEAMYTYDTLKIPEYTSTYSSYYLANTGTTFVVNNIYEGMKTLTKFLDATVPCAWEFGLRVEALPRLDGITQSNVEDNIYVLPFPLNQGKAVSATFKRFQLQAGTNGFSVRRDYRRMANNCRAWGDGCSTQQIRTDKILAESDIDSDNQTFHIPAGDQPVGSHYLKVTIDNPGSIPDNGSVELIFMDGVNEIEENFPVHLKGSAGNNHAKYIHFTTERSHDQIKDFTGVRVKGLGGWTPRITIMIEEVSNDDSPYHTTIAGKSLNQFGAATHTINGLWLNSQARVDLAAGKHCCLYHNPTHALYAPVISRYVSYDNLIGNTAGFYTPYEKSPNNFLITDVVYGFRGKLVTQHLEGMRYEYDWDYDDTNIYVYVGGDHVTVSGEYVTI